MSGTYWVLFCETSGAVEIFCFSWQLVWLGSDLKFGFTFCEWWFRCHLSSQHLLYFLKLHHPWSLDSGSFLRCSSGSTPLLSVFGFVLHMQTWRADRHCRGGHRGEGLSLTYICLYVELRALSFQFFLVWCIPTFLDFQEPLSHEILWRKEKKRKKEKIYLVLFALLWLSLFPSPVARMRKFLSAFLVWVSAVLFCELDQSWAVEF